MCSDAPDTSRQDAVAENMSRMSQEQLDWAKQIYAETAPTRAAATQRANDVSDAQLESMRTQTGMAKEYDSYNKSTFRPLEQSIIKSAEEYNSPERSNANAARAQADVQTAMSGAMEQQQRASSRRGVNPSSGAALAMANQTSIQGAAAMAGAANKSRMDTEVQGYARKMDAIGLGKGLVGSQATSASLALSAGNNSSANGQASGNINAQGSNIMTTGYSGFQQGMSGAAGIYQNDSALQQKADDNSAIWGAAGTVAGAYM